MKDLWVKDRSARKIKQLVRELLHKANLAGRRKFCVVQLVEEYLVAKLKGGLTIVFFDQLPGQDPAFVSYSPTRLHIDREIWSDAKLGDPKARYIIAHEIGHLMMHDFAELAYSNSTENLLKAPPLERSAEWQANVFAHFLLVPDEVLLGGRALLDTAMEIAVPTWVIATVAAFDERRDIFEFIEENSYTGDICAACLNLTVFRNGLRLKCNACGSSTSYS